MLATIVRMGAENGYMPSIRELAEALGISSPNGVQTHLDALRRKGRLTWAAGKSRTYRVLGE